MKRLLCMLMLCALAGCMKGDPCPPKNLEVGTTEADAALVRQTRRKEREGNTDHVSVYFNCGYNRKQDGSYTTVDQVRILVQDVLWCLDKAIPQGGVESLSSCLTALARSRFAGTIVNTTTRAMLDVVSKVTCLEFSRTVDLEADPHGLQRLGPSWVEITIFAAVQILNAAMAPVTAPAMFLIKPGRGGAEEACVDTGAPPKRCSSTDGCADLPAGAEGIDGGSSGGGVIPPGTDPGGIPGSSGDFP